MTPEQKAELNTLIDLAYECRNARINEIVRMSGNTPLSELIDELEDPLLVQLDGLWEQLLQFLESQQ
jgi:hypothetical protein